MCVGFCEREENNIKTEFRNFCKILNLNNMYRPEEITCQPEEDKRLHF